MLSCTGQGMRWVGVWLVLLGAGVARGQTPALLLENTEDHLYLAAVRWPATNAGLKVTCLARDNTGRVWVGTDGDGVFCCDPSVAGDNAWQHFTQRDGLTDLSIYALACDRQGRLWAGTLRHGVMVYNGTGWRTYDPTQGPLGERIYALAVDPTAGPEAGNVWMASNRGLACYHPATDSWSYLTLADGLPSNEIGSVAVGADGRLVVGTLCHGLAIRDQGSSQWRPVEGPQAMPNAGTGRGLPTSIINQVLVAADGAIYVATPGGLGYSRDGGRHWRFVRGEDWADRVAGLYQGPKPDASAEEGDLLSQDYITALAEDTRHRIWVGYRCLGAAVLDPATGRIEHNAVQFDDPGFGFLRAILPLPGRAPLAGFDGEGLFALTTDFRQVDQALEKDGTRKEPAPRDPKTAPAFPSPANPPALSWLRVLVPASTPATHPATTNGPQGVYLGDDWTTQGDWVGRYGRRLAILYGYMCPMNTVISWSADYGYSSHVGPHQTQGGPYTYIGRLDTKDRRMLYGPTIGARRDAEMNDGSFNAHAYPMTFQGPDLWIGLRIRAPGVHRISLYFVNNDGHSGKNRYRDYLVALRSGGGTPAEALKKPILGQTRVVDFYGGVYKQFLVAGPGEYSIQIERGQSFVTKVQGLFVDRLTGPPDRLDAMPLPWMGDVRYGPASQETMTQPDRDPRAAKRPQIEQEQACTDLWKRLEPEAGTLTVAAARWPWHWLVYRAAVAGGASAGWLENWRWQLGLWDDQQRQQFDQSMAQAWQKQLEITPQLRRQGKQDEER